VLESITVAIQQPPRWILKVVRGPSKFEWRYAETEISASPRGLSVTETRYQHGFTSPSPWWRPTDATRRRWSACSRERLSCGGRACAARRPSISRRDGSERCGYRDGGGAPGWQCASIQCDIMAQRRDGGVLAVAPQRRMSMRGLWRACGGAAGGDGAAAIAPGDAVPKRARH